MGDEKSSNVKLTLWLSFIAFLIIIAVFHSKISEISFGEKGVSAKMISAPDVSSLSPQERQSNQQELDQRVRQLESQIKSPAPPVSAANTGNALNPADFQSSSGVIQGYWRDVYGSVFTIQQSGGYVGMYGYTNNMLYLVASGQFDGANLSMQTYNLAGRYGMIAVQVSPDGRQLNGTYTDTGAGQSWPIQIFR